MPDREQYTLRLPAELMVEAREQASAYGQTVNDVLVDVISAEMRRRRAQRLLDEARILRGRIAAEGGVQPDSTATVRALREGRTGDEDPHA